MQRALNALSHLQFNPRTKDRQFFETLNELEKDAAALPDANRSALNMTIKNMRSRRESLNRLAEKMPVLKTKKGEDLYVGDIVQIGKGYQKWHVTGTYPDGTIRISGDPSWASIAGGRTQSRVVKADTVHQLSHPQADPMTSAFALESDNGDNGAIPNNEDGGSNGSQPGSTGTGSDLSRQVGQGRDGRRSGDAGRYRPVVGGRKVALAGSGALPATGRESAITEDGGSTPQLFEIDARVEAKTYREAIQKSAEGKYGAAVYVYDESEYRDMRLFMNDSGTAGFALKGDELVSVFSTPEAGRGVGRHLVASAVAQGATRLDAFDTVLPGIYAREGFVPVARVKWDDEYAPDGWDYETFGGFNKGRPDVVFMRYSPDAVGDTYRPGSGKYVSDYDAGVDAAKPVLTDHAAVTKVLDEAYTDFEVTDEQVEALEDYTETAYEGMNASLRSDGKDYYGNGLGVGFSGGGRRTVTPEERAERERKRREFVDKRVADLRQYIDAAPPLPTSVQVYRVADADVSESLREGDLFVDKGFTSVTYDQKVLGDFYGEEGIFGDEEMPTTVFDMVLPRGTKALAVLNKTAGHEAQSEIILPPGSQFRVVRKVVDGIVTRITLEAV